MGKVLTVLALVLFSNSLFSQVSFSELVSINSLQSFQRVVIENNFELSEYSNDSVMVYGYALTKADSSGETASQWASYNKKSSEFRFVFKGEAEKNRMRVIYQQSGLEIDKYFPYSNLVTEIKSNCTFYKIIDNYSCYSCSKSLYKGKIGFRLMDGHGMIRHFPEQ